MHGGLFVFGLLSVDVMIVKTANMRSVNITGAPILNPPISFANVIILLCHL